MQIRRQANLNLLFSLIIIMGTTIVLIFSNHKIEHAREKREVATKIVASVLELNIVLNDYLITLEGDTKLKWSTLHEDLAKILVEQSRVKNIEPGFIQTIREDHEALRTNFSRLVMSERKNQAQSEKIDIDIQSTVGEQEQAIIDLLKKHAQSMAATATNMSNAADDEIRDAWKTSFTIVTSLFAVLLFLLLSNAYIMRNLIGKRLTPLTDTAKKLAQGNLKDIKKDKTITNYDDEVSELAHAFYTMAAKLQEYYSELEQKVEEKTIELTRNIKELSKQQKTLTKHKKATLNLLEDLDEERKKLAQSKAKDEAMLSSIGDGLVFTNLKKQITFMNESAEKILGWKEQEVQGKNWMKIVQAQGENKKHIPEEELPIGKILVETSKNRIINSSGKYYYTRKNGEKFPVAITASTVSIEKQPIGIIVVFRDITHEKEVDKAKTEFVSLASHQLRTPLTSIKWNAEMLLAGDAGELTEEQKQFTEEIRLGNKRMIELVNALLDVSRIELGTFSIETLEVDIVNVAKAVVSELHVKIDEKKMQLTEEYGELPRIQADPKLLRMIIENLLTNAIKYTPEKGKVHIEITQKDKKILIKVQDNGLGIPKKQQDKIFSKLFRADNVKQSDTEGTGLGLYLVKSIIEYSGGEIYFESEENQGTTFYANLPLSGMKPKKGKKSLGDRQN